MIELRMGVQKLLRYVDYFSVQLDDLGKNKESILNELRDVVREESNKEFKRRTISLIDCESCLPPPIPLLVKVDSDVSDSDITFISDLAKQSKIDGIVLDGKTSQKPESLKEK